MNKKEINTILQIVDLAVKYGVPAVSDAINKTDKKVITEEVVQNLKIDKQGEDYFDKKIKDTVKTEVDKQSQAKNVKPAAKSTTTKKSAKSKKVIDESFVDKTED